MINKIHDAGMHVESWAEGLFRSKKIEPRVAPLPRRFASISNQELGFNTPLVSIAQTKEMGLSKGLRYMTPEDILALRLSYADQPPEWMRVAMETHVDEDESYLDAALVNDGARRDIRTTWAFPQNVYQLRHKWIWRQSD